MFFLSVDLPMVDFKGEAITFKTTTAAVIDTLEHCAELVTQREESWRKRLEKEIERRKRAEALSNSYFMQIQKSRNIHPGPDLEVSFKFCYSHFCKKLTIVSKLCANSGKFTGILKNC